MYLDICCLKRPFDDPRAARIRREAEAVAEILESVENGRIRLVRSPAHDFENERNSREDRRLATSLWLQAAAVRVQYGETTAKRARELTELGFGPLDSLHLAFAEEAEVRCFLTTDDRLLARARTSRDHLRVEVASPDHFLARSAGGV